MSELSIESQRSIQGIAIAGFRKDHQELIGITFGADLAKTRAFVLELARRTATAWEVKTFNELYRAIRDRSERDGDETIQAHWIGFLISARGFRTLRNLPIFLRHIRRKFSEFPTLLSPVRTSRLAG